MFSMLTQISVLNVLKMKPVHLKCQLGMKPQTTLS